jgi:hypothetical protein
VFIRRLSSNGALKGSSCSPAQAQSNKEKESQAAKEWDMVDGGSSIAPGTQVVVAAEDLHMSAVPKRVVQLADIIAVRFLSFLQTA